MKLIGSKLWWTYRFDSIAIIKGEDRGRWCTDPDRYVLGRRRPVSDRGRRFTDLGRY